MSGRFPAARTVEELWQILLDGCDVLSSVPADRVVDWSDPEAREPNTVRCGFVPGIAEFDPSFFEISPREAQGMDPRQRLLLQEAWRALEDAGYGERKLRAERIGMFVGAEQGDYLHLTQGQGSVTAHHEAILASRLAYFLDFSGPVLAINTACSSGLVAAHQACASLRNGECDAAVVAGVNLATSSRVFAETSKAGMLSEDGVCYAFDKRANGMVLGEAVAVVVLKRLTQAEADGDRVLAVIRGSGINYDGRTNGITAPSGAAQANLYRAVYEQYGIDPARIEHLVAHGTGTRLGDPVEVNALNEVFKSYTRKVQFCALTSPKANLGHTLAASGVVSLIALVQALAHGVIPASLHCEQDSDYIAWKDSPFFVNKAARPWPASSLGTRLGAVSSFGMSGTNVHMVVESYPREEASERRHVAPAYLLALSAKSADGLQDRIRELRAALEHGATRGRSLSELSFTLLDGRQHFAHRCAVVVETHAAALLALRAAEVGDTTANVRQGVVARESPDRTALQERGEALLVTLASSAPSAKYGEALGSLADLYCQGVQLDWRALFTMGVARPCWLPGYPFSRKTYWIGHAPGMRQQATAGSASAGTAPASEVRGHAEASRTSSSRAAQVASAEILAGVGSRSGSATPPRVVLQHASIEVSTPARGAARPRKVSLVSPGTSTPEAARELQPAAVAPPPVRPTAEMLPPSMSTPSGEVSVRDSLDVLRRELRASLAEALYLQESNVELDRRFLELGLDSIVGVEWVKTLNKRYGLSLAATKIYDYPSVRLFSEFLHAELAARTSGGGDVVRATLAAPTPTEVAAPVHGVPAAEPTAPSQDPRRRAALMEELRASLAEALFLEPHAIDLGRNFVELGMDSIIGVEWVKTINRRYGTTLFATRLYDYSTIRELASFLESQLHAGASAEAPTDGGSPVANQPDVRPALPEPVAMPSEGAPSSGTGVAASSVPVAAPERIAVIGMSGRYPDADDLRHYWDNLRDGRDSVREVPASRWNIADYYDPRPGQPGKVYCKWQGALDDIDCFDPLFFSMSPLEAEGLDPQHRLFLEEAYRAFEDAGYAPQSLSKKRCGVYLGVSGNEYSFLVYERSSEASAATSNSNAIAAARIAYFLNLRGPALAIDTACSSSLVALHLAHQALASHEIDLALVGGVSLYLLPDTFIGMCQAGMLSPEGKCKTFDNGANGFVPGEAVGAVVLKRLSEAEVDRDHIYGVVLASGINQDGKTNGITAPSATSQMELVRAVYERYGIDPASVGYVEMHGTGTKLGDPIELDALGTVYRERGVPVKSCVIGSVKSNIGHSSAAAGLAGIHKSLLCLRHGMFVPTLHFEQPNEHFDFESSPFEVNTRLRPWPARGGDPRRAVVSSFGYSGTNAHVVLEEYRAVRHPRPASSSASLIVLSAKTAAQLQSAAENLRSFFLAEPAIELADAAFTLQLGRAELEVRLAFVADSKEAVLRGLEAYLGRAEGPTICQGRVSSSQVTWDDEDEAKKRLVRSWIDQRDLQQLAAAWVVGTAIDWRHLQLASDQPRRVPLPTYPFAKERYWIEPSQPAAQSVRPGAAFLHPLLHENTSVFGQQRYRSTFHSAEPVARDHRVRGEAVLPGVAYLEMAIAAATDAAQASVLPGGALLRNVVWVRPLRLVDGGCAVEVALRAEPGDGIEFEISTSAAGEPGASSVVHCQGTIVLGQQLSPGSLDVSALVAECRGHELDGAAIYAAFEAVGIEYGASYRGIERLFVGARQAMARLALPPTAHGAWGEWRLHPSIMDAALQASLGMLLEGDSARGDVYLPLAVEEIELVAPLERTMWCWIRSGPPRPGDVAARRLDLDLCDDAGRVCVRVRGFMLRALRGEPAIDRVLVAPSWQPRAAVPAPMASVASRTVLFVEEGPLAAALAVEDPSCQKVMLSSRASSLDRRYRDYASQVLARVQEAIRDGSPAEVVMQILVPPQAPWLAGLAGLLRSAQLENPKIVGQIIIADDESPSLIDARARAERGQRRDTLVRYRGGQREVLLWRETPAVGHPSLPWKAAGVYLITGGLGGLGRIFAEEIVRQVKDVTLLLTGRSPESNEARRFIAELRTLGARVSYSQLDVAQREQVDAFIAKVRGASSQSLHGIIHAAGVLRDSFVLKKTGRDLDEVLAPKVSGLVNLDEATRALDLDFFVTFSSGAAVAGNVGQADYAAANAFMDAYAAYREGLVAAGTRRGRTLSINWPLWADGGMRPDGTAEAALRERFGISLLDRRSGVTAFYQALEAGCPRVLVAAGDTERIRSALQLQHAHEDVQMKTTASPQVASISGSDLEQRALDYIKTLLASALKVPPHRIEPEVALERYGIDSVMAMALTAKLESAFGRLSKTLFFEYQTIKDLTGYFLAVHEGRLRELLGGPPALAAAAAAAPAPAPRRDEREVSRAKPTAAPSRFGSADIAIIGLAGRYPQARNPREFWRNLVAGKDSITEIPPERWDHGLYFDEDKSKPNKTYCKWGGFLDGVDQFDPLFFNMSPREVEITDPQERLFLECVYETLEDAGYTRQELMKHRSNGVAANVGVFVGVMYDEYQLYGATEQALERGQLIPGNAASISNRVSYFCNWQGPSMTVKTMCSSSLTALHLACQSLQLGDCEVAVAGGVNLSLHPGKYLLLGQSKFASSKGLCEAFGIGGDGYVPGEGVGAVLLKPLASALADNDRIYAVIKATAVNHGGKTNGYTVPNPNAQSDVISHALAKAGIDARAVSYVEAHGTGTSLGDPIEIAGLTKAFSRHTSDKQFCAIGSVKSNIGHCESAAGISGLTKVLLQMRHGRLVPSLHSRVPNPHIEFGETPFRVVQELEEWKRPVVTIDGQTRQVPRIAGLSSFGAGGSNAHVLIEEYVPAGVESDRAAPAQPAIIVLSAKHGDQLREQVRRLLDWAEEEQIADSDLADIAFTLQVGREAMDERLALIVGSVRELVAKLRDYLEGKDEVGGLYQGKVKRSKDAVSLLSDDEDVARMLESWIDKGKLGRLVELWVNGLTFDWRSLYRGATPRRISLPTYPFARKRCWLPRAGLANESSRPSSGVAAVGRPANGAARPSSGAADLSESASGPTAGVIELPRSSSNGPIRVKALEVAPVQPVPVVPRPKKIVLSPLDGNGTVSPSLEAPADRPLKAGALAVAGVTALGSAPIRVLEVPAVVAPVLAIPSQETLLDELAASLAQALYMDERDVDPDSNFTDLGLDSIIGVEWIKEINKRYGLSLAALRLYDNPTVRQMAAYLHTTLRTSGSSRAPNGRSAAKRSTEEPATEEPPEPDPGDDEFREELSSSLAHVLRVPARTLDADRSFDELGLDAVLAEEWLEVVRRRHGASLGAAALVEHSNLRSLAAHVRQRFLGSSPRRETSAAASGAAPPPSRVPGFISEPAPAPEPVPPPTAAALADARPESVRPAALAVAALPDDAVAIVGMAGRYPLADDMELYWRNLESGRNCIREIPKSRWDVAQYFDPKPNQPGKTYCKWMGFLDDIEIFDPLFFSIPPSEAEGMDPQQRLFLQEAYHAFEDAGYGAPALSGKKCGVYLGIMSNEYSLLLQQHGGASSSATSNSNAIAAARIAYFLNLKGPAIAIDTACSSSLVATHLAAQALKAGEIDMALVGGVTLYLTAESFVSMCGAGMLSPAGQCKTFDNGADGFVPGEGVGALVLKRLADAERDRDHIYGVIRGSGINQDGKTNGITAPSVVSQMELEREVYERHGIDPASVGYVEMHGTGTKLGDPIELEALGTVYREKTDRVAYCAIGSVKSNLGHTSAAAGIASVQKALLCMAHQRLVPTLNFQHHNEHFDFGQSPFYVNTESRPWSVDDGQLRRAAVSAFGFSGTNAHLVLEEYVGRPAAGPAVDEIAVVVALSARSEEQLASSVARIERYLGAHASVNLQSLAYSLQVGREAMKHRLAFVVATREELMEKLARYLRGERASDLIVGQVKKTRDRAPGPRSSVEVSLEDGKPQMASLESIAALWVTGQAVDWERLYPSGPPRRIPLPTYPFARQRYWLAAAPPLPEPATQPARGAAPPAELVAPAGLPSAQAFEGQASRETPAAGASSPADANILLKPVWDVVAKPASTSPRVAEGRLVVVASKPEHWTRLQSAYAHAERLAIDDADTVETIAARLDASKTPVAHLIWVSAPGGQLGATDDALIAEQERGLYACFRTLKALLSLGYGRRALALTVLTENSLAVLRNDPVDATHAGLHGLMGSVAKEYPSWNVVMVDLERDKAWPLEEALALPCDERGIVWGNRRKRWYRQALVPIRGAVSDPAGHTAYRQGGTYIVIGGAGGIGEAWTEHMIRTYQANVIWLGRRPEDAMIRSKLDRLGRLGPAPHYVQADATSRDSLQQAYRKIRERFPVIHGIVHSAIVLLDQSLARMDEDRFRAAVSAKVDVSVRLAQVFGREPLDFVLFFSSMNSFLKAPGQCNYVAGSVFADSYAYHLARESPAAVKVMNWGYWGSVGIVASQQYQERMKKAGAASIEPADGMAALDVLISGPFEQLGLVKAQLGNS